MAKQKVINECPQCGGHLVVYNHDYNDDTRVVKLFMKCGVCSYRFEQEVKAKCKPIGFFTPMENFLCPECGEMNRPDLKKVGELIEKVLNKEQPQLKIDVQCFGCGHRFEVNLHMDS